MNAFRISVCLLCVSALSTPAYGQDKKSAGKGIDPATVAAYEKLGAVYGGWRDGKIVFERGPAAAAAGLPGFRFPADFKGKLPKVNVPFALEFAADVVTDARLVELGGLTKLVQLDL